MPRCSRINDPKTDCTLKILDHTGKEVVAVKMCSRMNVQVTKSHSVEVDMTKLSTDAWLKFTGGAGDGTDGKMWRQVTDPHGSKELTPEAKLAKCQESVKALYSGDFKTRGASLPLEVEVFKSNIISLAKAKGVKLPKLPVNQ